MPNRLRNLTVEFVSLVDRAAVRNPSDPSQPQRFLLAKSEVPVWKSQAAPTHTPEGGHVADIDDVRAELEKAQQERDEAREAAQKSDERATSLEARIADLEKNQTPADPAEEPIDKSELPEPVRRALEKAEADAAAANERIAKAEELAKAEREIRVTREFIAKADEYRALPFNSTEFGPVLKAASEKLTPDEYAAIEGVLKAADQQIATSDLFKEHGRSGEPTGDTADQSITQKAEEIRKADPSLSPAKALERALHENPQLAAGYLASVR